MIEKLVCIGFQKEVAQIALVATGYDSLERAISYITDKDEDDLFQRSFIRENNGSELYKMCFAGENVSSSSEN